MAKIPSGVYTALAGKYGDLLGAGNDINLRWIANRTWIYSTTFDLGKTGNTGEPEIYLSCLHLQQMNLLRIAW